MADALTRATLEITEDNLGLMVLGRDQIPPKFRDFGVSREGVLDNAAMAEQGFPGHTSEGLRAAGRITGFLREFASPKGVEGASSGTDVVVATAVHLFDDRDGVSAWMTDVFLKQFEDNVGKSIAPKQTLGSVERMAVEGFHDEALAIKTVQEGPKGLLSSTVVDFRIGRLLGVAFSATVGDVTRRALVERLGALLEKQIVRVVLGAA